MNDNKIQNEPKIGEKEKKCKGWKKDKPIPCMACDKECYNEQELCRTCFNRFKAILQAGEHSLDGQVSFLLKIQVKRDRERAIHRFVRKNSRMYKIIQNRIKDMAAAQHIQQSDPFVKSIKLDDLKEDFEIEKQDSDNRPKNSSIQEFNSKWNKNSQNQNLIDDAAQEVKAKEQDKESDIKHQPKTVEIDQKLNKILDKKSYKHMMQKIKRKIIRDQECENKQFAVHLKPPRPDKMDIDGAFNYYREVAKYRKYQFNKFQAELKFQNEMLTTSRARTESEEKDLVQIENEKKEFREAGITLRKNKTPTQEKVLIREFENCNQHWNNQKAHEVSLKVGLTYKLVQNWNQDYRRRNKISYDPKTRDKKDRERKVFNWSQQDQKGQFYSQSTNSQQSESKDSADTPITAVPLLEKTLDPETIRQYARTKAGLKPTFFDKRMDMKFFIGTEDCIPDDIETLNFVENKGPGNNKSHIASRFHYVPEELRRRDWTEEKKNILVEAVLQHGAKNLDILSQQTGMSRYKISMKLYLIQSLRNSNMTEEEYSIVDIIKRDRPEQVKWSALERKNLCDALPVYGKNWKQLEVAVGTKNKKEIQIYMNGMKLNIFAHPNHPDKHLLPLLMQKIRNRDYTLYNRDEKGKNRMCYAKNYEGDKTVTKEEREKEQQQRWKDFGNQQRETREKQRLRKEERMRRAAMKVRQRPGNRVGRDKTYDDWFHKQVHKMVPDALALKADPSKRVISDKFRRNANINNGCVYPASKLSSYIPFTGFDPPEHKRGFQGSIQADDRQTLPYQEDEPDQILYNFQTDEFGEQQEQDNYQHQINS